MQIADRSMVWNSDLIEALELENLLINAAITVTSAEQRTVRVASLPYAFHLTSRFDFALSLGHLSTCY